ncbi:hypothetical protein PF005_g9393 [Phytophthora fragariae]|uniref:Uncharacterized protein n=1 Tax=Phytophthora fragariae TaxID=53985 RepID=A0A6A4E8W8_9STRA|nr:hypothetical protein PF003_g3466 [Phytophthora fragariae]KAE8939732.1 hypothetical protein PF009_g10435 [Phytophthora fragariae]KAE9011083.1 hypothetical protein PF011_g9528 [Phytophthora fragariae]KAE9117077.1 hypothetical protein PF010_g8735 [Phytophthora fragariae]KAE9117460.1 hypothetical protein PF007_g9282 [Phytophthora fragariae]
MSAPLAIATMCMASVCRPSVSQSADHIHPDVPSDSKMAGRLQSIPQFAGLSSPTAPSPQRLRSSSP